MRSVLGLAIVSCMFLALVSMHGCASTSEYEKATISYQATGYVLNTTYSTLKSLHDTNVINDDDYIAGLMLLSKATIAHDAVGRALESMLDIPPLPEGADVDMMELQEARKRATKAMYDKARVEFVSVIRELQILITEFSQKGGE